MSNHALWEWVDAKKPAKKTVRKSNCVVEQTIMTQKELNEWVREQDKLLRQETNGGRPWIMRQRKGRWVLKEEENFTAPDAQAGAGGTSPAGATPPGGAGAGAGGPPDADGGPPPGATGKEEKPVDTSDDPQAPDMPDTKDPADFERWKNNYLKESIKGDAQKLIEMLHDVRDLDLDAYPRKFVEDNIQIQFLRQNSNIEKASKEIRKAIREQLDQNNPSVSVVNHVFNVLQQDPTLGNIFIKLEALHGMKGDLHRKYLAALIGGVQVGSGGNNEDVIFNEKVYAIRLSTRMNARWGMIDIGRWALKEDDPERYLSEPELKRLEEGSPEEKDVLRRRVVMESIADYFKKRAFVANVVSKDGTVYILGWDLSNSLRAAYTDGKLIVKTTSAENSEAMIDDEGAIIPFIEMKILYERETGKLDEDGKPEKEAHEFMVRRDGMLFLSAQFQIIKEAATSFQGIVLKEIPYKGNPSDLRTLSRCVPSCDELLTRKC